MLRNDSTAARRGTPGTRRATPGTLLRRSAARPVGMVSFIRVAAVTAALTSPVEIVTHCDFELDRIIVLIDWMNV